MTDQNSVSGGESGRRRYFIKLSYDGSAFHGWQRQPNASSVQQTVEEALSTVLGIPVVVTGAGRTDTGVNAREMYAHFDVPEIALSRISDTQKIIGSLRRLCGRMIGVMDLLPVSPEAHARFDATLRRYRYFAIFSPSPFAGRYAWSAPDSLDVEAMNEAASILKATDDFTSFAKLHGNAATNICRVSEAVWTPYQYPTGEAGLVFTIAADRFLRNMVRAVVGTLVEVGRGKMTVPQFRDVIAARDRCAAGTSMPAQALFLWDVEYGPGVLPDICPDNADPITPEF